MMKVLIGLVGLSALAVVLVYYFGNQKTPSYDWSPFLTKPADYQIDSMQIHFFKGKKEIYRNVMDNHSRGPLLWDTTPGTSVVRDKQKEVLPDRFQLHWVDVSTGQEWQGSFSFPQQELIKAHDLHLQTIKKLNLKIDVEEVYRTLTFTIGINPNGEVILWYSGTEGMDAAYFAIEIAHFKMKGGQDSDMLKRSSQTKFLFQEGVTPFLMVVYYSNGENQTLLVPNARTTTSVGVPFESTLDLYNKDRGYGRPVFLDVMWRDSAGRSYSSFLDFKDHTPFIKKWQTGKASIWLLLDEKGPVNDGGLVIKPFETKTL